MNQLTELKIFESLEEITARIKYIIDSKVQLKRSRQNVLNREESSEDRRRSGRNVIYTQRVSVLFDW